MVYLIRRVRVRGDWEKFDEAAEGLKGYWARQPQVKSVELWGNIAGPQDEYRFVAKFESLAEEEKFALGLWNDKGYEAVMMKFIEVFDLKEDELVRAF